jgi:porphobilinogen synthase
MADNGNSSARVLSVGPQGVEPGRAREAVRALYARPGLMVRDLTAPLLVQPNDRHGGDLPGVVSLERVGPTVRRLAGLGIRGVKVFAYGTPRDASASGATVTRNLMCRAVEEIKTAAPEVVVTTEVCGCSWTDHGECAILDARGRIDTSATYDLMGRMAVVHALAGADVASPTAMLAGSVRAVRSALDDAGMPDVGVCPNIAIHTALYGPFKKIMGTNPGRGHRRGLQLEPGRADRDAIMQADRWLAEGADSLTVQPVLTCTDVLVRLRDHTRVPLVAYSTSGEYAALAGLGDAAVVEYHAGLKRAGADLILSFAAEQVARALTTDPTPEGDI